MSEDISADSPRAGTRAAEHREETASDGSREPSRAAKDSRREKAEASEDDRDSGDGKGAHAPKKDDRATEPEPRTDAEQHDGPVSEKDALRSLVEGGGHADAERTEALRAGALADEIARRLNADASGTRIGTLALFNETVSFGGGFHTGGARAGGPRTGGVSVLTMDAAEITDHTELFVAPEDYGQALDALCERRVLVLTGAPGSGREAVAVNLLEEALAMGGEGAGCRRLLTPAAVLEAGWEPPMKHSGYVAALDDGSPVVEKFTSALLSGHSHGTAQWAAVVATLRASGCYLVLTGGHDLEVLATGPGGDQVARHPLAPVDPLAVVERRVLGHGGSPDAHADLHALLERTGAATALREQPAARNAARLASVIRADGDVAAAVAQLRDPSEQVRAWFNRYRAPDAVAFALAAAVLEECGYLTVADAAVTLRAALTEPELAPPDLRFGDRLGYEQQWIRLVVPAEGFGAPRVRFRNVLLGQVILAYAWNLLDGRRDAVLDWLRRLLSHRDLEVRARASVAAGVLALADPHYAVHRFLTSWAGSTSWPLRQAAATALGVAGSRPETAEAVGAAAPVGGRRRLRLPAPPGRHGGERRGRTARPYGARQGRGRAARCAGPGGRLGHAAVGGVGRGPSRPPGADQGGARRLPGVVPAAGPVPDGRQGAVGVRVRGVPAVPGAGPRLRRRAWPRARAGRSRAAERTASAS